MIAASKVQEELLFFVIYPLIQLTLSLLSFCEKYEFCGKVEKLPKKIEILFFLILKMKLIFQKIIFQPKKKEQLSQGNRTAASYLS